MEQVVDILCAPMQTPRTTAPSSCAPRRRTRQSQINVLPEGVLQAACRPAHAQLKFALVRVERASQRADQVVQIDFYDRKASAEMDGSEWLKLHAGTSVAIAAIVRRDDRRIYPITAQ